MLNSAKLVEQLYSSLNRHDYRAMANCYHEAAGFRDIAFDLKGRDQISAMWQMICSGEYPLDIEIVRADEASAVANLVDEYTFTDTGRRVRNPIEPDSGSRTGSSSTTRTPAIPGVWAAAAVGGIGGFLAGRLRFVRAWKARAKLRRFIQANARNV